MVISRLVDKNEIVKASKEISIDDRLIVNHRNRYLKAVAECPYYKDNHEIEKFYILEGNGTNYLFVVYRTTRPFIYTGSNFEIQEVNYTDGYAFTTSTKSSERVRELSVSSLDHCDDCDCSRLYDSVENEFYCPRCEV